MNGCTYIERVSAYHDGELAGAAVAEVERHLGSCAECAAELERFRGMSRAFASAELPRLPMAARRRLRRAVEQERAAGRLQIVRALTAMAASIFLVAATRVIHIQNVGPGTARGEEGGDTLQVADWELVAVSRDPSAVAGVAGREGPTLPARTTGSSFVRFVVDDLEKGND